MRPPTLHYRWVVFRRWIMPGSAVLIGLTLVALVIGGNQAGAAPPAVPPDTLAPPSPPAPASTRLAPTAQISASTCPLDVVVVMDRSGSMDYDTICFNCFERTEPDQLNNPNYVQYPENGVRYPVVSNTVTSNLCLANPGDGVEPILYNSYHYQILEAELYSLNSSTWERRFRTTGRGYWTINRYWTDTWKAPKPIDPIPGGQTAPGAVSHHPFVTFTDNTTSSPLFGRFYTLADAQNGIAPRLEYDFALPAAWSGDTAYIWIRARQGERPDSSKQPDGTTNPDAVYWGVDSSAVSNGDNIGVGTGWTWVRLGSMPGLARGDAPYTWHTLKIWADSPGYTIDRIIITDNWGSSLPSQITSSPSQANAQFDTSGGRRNWTTPGSARRQACDPCNPIFGLNITDPRLQTEGGQCLGYYPLLGPTDNLANELFSDVQPIRGSKEAIKNFVRRNHFDNHRILLSPESDPGQIGDAGRRPGGRRQHHLQPVLLQHG